MKTHNSFLVIIAPYLIVVLACQFSTLIPTLQTQNIGRGSAEPPISESTQPPARPGQNVQLGPWKISFFDEGNLADYDGSLPEEGHKYYQITLSVVNDSNTPVLFSSSGLGSFEAEWDTYTYYAKKAESLQGYIPPGWPLRVRVIFDLPTIAENPKFKLIPRTDLGGQEESIDLGSLGSDLTFTAPSILDLGTEFTVQDRISIVPTSMALLQIEQGDFANGYMLFLDALVKNLYGHDIDIGQEPLVFQLFSQGQIIPITASPDYYYLPGASPNYSFKWFAPPPKAGFDAFGTETDGSPLAPGLEREGSFWMNIWGQIPPSMDMLVLVMYGSNNVFSYQPNEWALFRLNDAAASLINEPLFPIDNIKLMQDRARQEESQGNSVAAANLLGIVARAHPADLTIAGDLQNAQQRAGYLVFLDQNNTSSTHTMRVIKRAIGSDDSAIELITEIPGIYDGNIISPDGRHLIYWNDFYDNENITVVNIEGEQASTNKVVSLGDLDNEQIYSLAWGPSSDTLVFAVGYSWGMTRIITLDINTTEVRSFPICEDIGRVSEVAWNPSNNWVTFFDYFEGIVANENFDNLECNLVLQTDDDLVPLALSQDGSILYLGVDKQIKSISLTSGNYYPTALSRFYSSEIFNLFINPEGRYLVFTLRSSEDIYLLDVVTQQLYEESPSDLSYSLIGWIP